MEGCGAGWRVRTTFLGAVRSPWELSLSSPVGLGTRRPPTYVGARDHRPTAVSAPRSRLHRLSSGDIAIAPDPRRSEGGPAPRGARAPRRGWRRRRRAAFSRRLADEGLRLARLWRPETVSAFHPVRDEPDTLELLRGARRGGLRDRASGRHRPAGRRWSSAAGGRAIRPVAGPMRFAEPLDDGARGRSRSAVRAARLLRPARPSHRLRRRPLRPHACAGLRAMKAVHAVGVAYGVCEVAAVPYEAA